MDADRLRERFRGQLVLPGDAGYDGARQVFNQRVQGRPAMVARCAGVTDVRTALHVADELGLDISVRGGGHHVAGWSSNDGGLVIDLTELRGVRVDPSTSTAWVGGGATAADVLLHTGRFGLAPVTGASPNIGVAGLTMGLGEGYLTPRYGFGCDNLLAFELVLADGKVLHVSADTHQELFWAMRGAGANFGVVTALQLQLQPAPQQAVGGWLRFAEPDVARVTRRVWEVMEHGSEWFFPLPVLGVDASGRLELSILPGHTGSAELAEREIGELRAGSVPASDETRTMSYAELVHQIPGLPGRAVWDLHRFEFGAGADRQIDFLLTQADRLTPFAMVNLWRTVPTQALEPPGVAPRLPGINVCLMSKWQDPADDAEQLRWLADTTAALTESGEMTEAANAVNHVSMHDDRRVRNLYGDATYRELARLKARYDPRNIFRRNYNIAPAG